MAGYLREHPDKGWIFDKIGGHGGAYGYLHKDYVSHIYFIGNRSKLYVVYLNIILYFRWLKRRIKKIRGV